MVIRPEGSRRCRCRSKRVAWACASSSVEVQVRIRVARITTRPVQKQSGQSRHHAGLTALTVATWPAHLKRRSPRTSPRTASTGTATTGSPTTSIRTSSLWTLPRSRSPTCYRARSDTSASRTARWLRHFARRGLGGVRDRSDGSGSPLTRRRSEETLEPPRRTGFSIPSLRIVSVGRSLPEEASTLSSLDVQGPSISPPFWVKYH